MVPLLVLQTGLEEGKGVLLCLGHCVVLDCCQTNVSNKRV